MKKLIAAAMLGALAFCAGLAHADTTTTVLANESALARDLTYQMDLQTLGIGNLSAVVSYTSATLPAKTFSDAPHATGTVTVVAPSALSTAAATNQVTVVSTAGLAGGYITMPGYVWQEGVHWKKGATTAATATNIATLLQAKVPWIRARAVGSVVYATAAYTGTSYNQALTTNKSVNLTIAHATFTGGQDTAVLSINGIQLRANKDWSPAGNATAVGAAIAAAIAANSSLNALVTASADSGAITLTARAAGTGGNYSLVTTTAAALSVSGAAMTGGTTPPFVIGGSAIAIPAHGFTLSLPLLYTQAAGKPIGGLTDQTTYYAAPVNAGSVKLASSKANAVAGTYIVFTASSAPTNTYTLTPLAISGTPSFKWQVADSTNSWSDVSGTAVTINSYSSPAATATAFLGSPTSRYVRLNVTAPTTGGLYLRATVIGGAAASYVYKTGDTMSGPLVLTGSGAAGRVTADEVVANTFTGDGSGITGVSASDVAAEDVQAGSLGSDVIASSVAAGAVGTQQLAGSIPDSKLAQLTTAGKVALSALASGTLDPAVKITTGNVDGTNGAGQLLQIDGSGALPAVNGAALTSVSGTDSSKVAKTGDTMTGTLTLSGPTADIVSGSSITASAFFGDASHMSGLPSGGGIEGACVDGDVLISTGGKAGCVGQVFRYEINNGPTSLTLQRTLNVPQIAMGASANNNLNWGADYIGYTASGGPRLNFTNGLNVYGYGDSILRILGGGFQMESPLTFSGGKFIPPIHTIAELQAITPGLGETYIVSDGVVPYSLAVGTAAAPGAFGVIPLTEFK
ncbi:MAG: hypothetical protein NTY77_05700 [Elusimicrobia bacterium]|nr:hypothetical protein [Elusimicrobiota bacterium]